MPGLNQLDELVAAVTAGASYQQIHPGLVQSIARQELAKGRSFKEAVRAVRSRLHQAGGAYQGSGIDYQRWTSELDRLGHSPADRDLQEFCRRVMDTHASTRERLPELAEFYRQTLGPVGPIHSLLDLACGLNPLALPWMALAPGADIQVCDIYADLVAFLNHFFTHIGLNGTAELCDLTAGVPARPVQVALLLKSIPCLEQLDKNCGSRLLENIRAEYLLVSFPAHSLGGRSKGMPRNYEKRFEELAAGQNWKIQRFRFFSEIAFLVQK